MNINLDQALVKVGPTHSFYGRGKLCAVTLSSSLLCHLCAAPSLAFAATATYPISKAIVANPERGFHISPDNCERTPWTKAFLDAEKARSDEPSTTLVRCVFYLPASQEQIPDQVALFAHQASVVKEAGLKMILRFAYFKNDGGQDAPLSRVLSHLSQLNSALQTHKNAIAVMESGFIGQWGEGHNSTYFPTNDWVNRKKVVEGIHAILPTHMVQVRTPRMKRGMYGPNAGINAYVGHHNDCFLASSNDMGTYGADVTEEKNYLAADTLNVAMGGETCKVNLPRSDCPTAVGTAAAPGELDRFHFTYLNRVYNQDVLNRWVSGGCMDSVRRFLGYRLALKSSTFPASVARGTILNAQIDLTNVGWAAPINNRPVYLELRNRVTNAIAAKIMLKTNMKTWKPDTVVNIEIATTIPAFTPAGDYNLFLRMPDPSPELTARPEFGIKLVNQTDVAMQLPEQTNQLMHVLRVTQ
jgi:hypothetical protein